MLLKMQGSLIKSHIATCCGGYNYSHTVSETGDRVMWFCRDCACCTDLVNVDDLARLERLALELQTERKYRMFELQESSLPTDAVDKEFSHKILELNRVIRLIVETRRMMYGKV